jgi:hypothetical protein
MNRRYILKTLFGYLFVSNTVLVADNTEQKIEQTILNKILQNTSIQPINIIGNITDITISSYFPTKESHIDTQNINLLCTLIGNGGQIALSLSHITLVDYIELCSDVPFFVNSVPKDILDAPYFYNNPLYKYKNYDVMLVSYILRMKENAK